MVDCNNFVIIKGKTTHKEILDISSITKEFNEKYEPSKPISHTIDLIEYDSKLPKVKNLEFILHKSENFILRFNVLFMLIIIHIIIHK